MILSKKKEVTTAYTIQKCKKCNMIQKRKFVKGDILFAESSKCASCDGMTSIDKIFGETIKQ